MLISDTCVAFYLSKCDTGINKKLKKMFAEVDEISKRYVIAGIPAAVLRSSRINREFQNHKVGEA